MSKFDLVITNGLVATASDIGRFDIGIKDGKISCLAPTFEPGDLEGVEVIDAEGAYVMPGGIDGHVHLSQDLNSGPNGVGGRCADDFETGSRSAAAGGTTTVVTFAPQTRAEEDRSLIACVERYAAKATATGSYVDYGFHVYIVRNDPEILRDELPILVNEALLDVMFAARKNKLTTLVHAENGDMIEWLTEKLEEKGMLAPWYHALSRPTIAASEATSRAISLAHLVQNPILFVHVGSSMAAEHIREAQSRGLPIYAETCPQYFNLTWDDLKRFHSPTCFENSKMICSPPPPPDSSEKDKLGLHNGTFTTFASDHCPFRYDDPHGKAVGITEHEASMEGEVWEQECHHQQEPHAHETCVEPAKLTSLLERKTGAFKYIPNGIPGVETRLPLLYTAGLLEGHITPQKFVEITSTNPAKIYGLYPRKGAIMPGSDADLVIWHPDKSFKSFKLQNDMLHHNVDYSPYEGQEFRNWPRYTILRGKAVFANGELVGECGYGQYLKRGPSVLPGYLPGQEKIVRRVAGWLYD